MNLSNLNDALDLFAQIGGTGNDNCIFFAQIDKAHIGEPGSVSKPVARRVLFRLTGGMSRIVTDIARSTAESKEHLNVELSLDVLNNYRDFLINETEESIAIIPVHLNSVFRPKSSEIEVFIESGRVISKSVIDKIEITKFNFITPNIRGVKFKLIDGYKLEYTAATNFRAVPYHIENFTKFCEKYKK